MMDMILCPSFFLCFFAFLEIFFVYLRKNMPKPIVMVKFDDIFFLINT